MKFYSLILSLIVSLSVFGQNDQSNVFEYTQKITESLKELKKLKPEDYIKNIDSHRSELEKYFSLKKRVCDGEFSTVILGNEASDVDVEPVKLTKEERKLCFRELKALQLTFINNMFVARKKYLENLHKERMQELENLREKSIESLQKSFNKKRRL